MDVYRLIFILFLFSIGLMCFLVPSRVQRFVISLNEKFGYIESEGSFRKSEKYTSRLRKLGVFVIVSTILLALIILWMDELVVYVVEKYEIEFTL